MKLSKQVYKEIHGMSHRQIRRKIFYELNILGLSNCEKEHLYKIRKQNDSKGI